jgi:hypothetical protein
MIERMGWGFDYSEVDAGSGFQVVVYIGGTRDPAKRSLVAMARNRCAPIEEEQEFYSLPKIFFCEED